MKQLQFSEELRASPVGFKFDADYVSLVRPSPIPSLCTRSTRAEIEWCCLPPCSLYGAVIPRAPPLGPGRALTLPCGWNNAGVDELEPAQRHLRHPVHGVTPRHHHKTCTRQYRDGRRLDTYDGSPTCTRVYKICKFFPSRFLAPPSPSTPARSLLRGPPATLRAAAVSTPRMQQPPPSVIENSASMLSHSPLDFTHSLSSKCWLSLRLVPVPLD